MHRELNIFILTFCLFIYGERLECQPAEALLTHPPKQNSADMKRAIYRDLSRFSETDWERAYGPGYTDAGKFVQKNGFILNYYPPEADTSVMFKNDTGYAMRMLKGVKAKNGKAEAELMLMGFAAPSILVRSKVTEGRNTESYYCVIFNHSTPQKRYQGINLWVYRGEWVLLKSFDLDIPRNEKIRFAVEFTDHRLTFFVNGVNAGTFNDPVPAYTGSVGIVSMEGPNRFYSFSFTEYD